MACEVCQHCHGVVSPTDNLVVRDGCSYHDKCLKCYVCSETNLVDAEVFKGVIFCNSCSKRIFQGCFTVKKAKNYRDRRSRFCCIQKLLDDAARFWRNTLALSDHTTCDKCVMQSGRGESYKKSSVEMGIITDVTQELLKEMKCPLPEYNRKPAQPNKPKEKSKKKSATDLRVAELGVSTEIANMALRHKSEMPVIIKSETKGSFSTSGGRRESDRTSHPNEDWLDSAYSSLADSSRSAKRRWMDRTLGSILRTPYTAFKRNILDRSSLISVLMSAENNRTTFMKRLEFLFHQEITDHQRRGLKRLYSTINRQKIPHKLGWLHLVDRVRDDEDNCSRCKHFRQSHSYRCMRAQVMRLSGPTARELAYFRERVANTLIPNFIRDTFDKKYAIMMSQACGTSIQESNK